MTPEPRRLQVGEVGHRPQGSVEDRTWCRRRVPLRHATHAGHGSSPGSPQPSLPVTDEDVDDTSGRNRGHAGEASARSPRAAGQPKWRVNSSASHHAGDDADRHRHLLAGLPVGMSSAVPALEGVGEHMAHGIVQARAVGRVVPRPRSDPRSCGSPSPDRSMPGRSCRHAVASAGPRPGGARSRTRPPVPPTPSDRRHRGVEGDVVAAGDHGDIRGIRRTYSPGIAAAPRSTRTSAPASSSPGTRPPPPTTVHTSATSNPSADPSRDPSPTTRRWSPPPCESTERRRPCTRTLPRHEDVTPQRTRRPCGPRAWTGRNGAARDPVVTDTALPVDVAEFVVERQQRGGPLVGVGGMRNVTRPVERSRFAPRGRGRRARRSRLGTAWGWQCRRSTAAARTVARKAGRVDRQRRWVVQLVEVRAGVAFEHVSERLRELRPRAGTERHVVDEVLGCGPMFAGLDQRAPPTRAVAERRRERQRFHGRGCLRAG